MVYSVVIQMKTTTNIYKKIKKISIFIELLRNPVLASSFATHINVIYAKEREEITFI